MPPGLCQCFIRDEVLCQPYKEFSTGSTCVPVVIPDVLKDTVVRETNGLDHLGIQRTLYTIRARFYWPGYENDVENWVKQCSQCQKHKGASAGPPGTHRNYYCNLFSRFHETLWDHFHLHYVGINAYILVVTDLFTKWVEARGAVIMPE